MQRLAGYIAKGAMAFLKAEWKVLSYFVVIAGILLAWSGTFKGTAEHPIHSSWIIAISFVIGAVLSALAGYIGMNIATKANVRTTQAARTSLAQALKVSFNGGTVMGLGVAGLAVIGLGSLFIVFLQVFHVTTVNSDEMKTAIEVLAGFSLGAESIALFARVGGGIYTKAADVGADLVGKVEAGIPEDDVRNPATIADNVGDNVGDVAGMGADLFGSYVATILATMVLGQEINADDQYNGFSPILLPMVIAGLGLIFSIIGTWFVRIKNETDSVQKALNLGNWSSIALTGIASYFVVQNLLPEKMSWFDAVRGEDFTRDGVFARRYFDEYHHGILYRHGQTSCNVDHPSVRHWPRYQHHRWFECGYGIYCIANLGFGRWYHGFLLLRWFIWCIYRRCGHDGDYCDAVGH
jgi:K(+)-stimulated pyrophosphate-energized sodium pump